MLLFLLLVLLLVLLLLPSGRISESNCCSPDFYVFICRGSEKMRQLEEAEEQAAFLRSHMLELERHNKDKNRLC